MKNLLPLALLPGLALTACNRGPAPSAHEQQHSSAPSGMVVPVQDPTSSFHPEDRTTVVPEDVTLLEEINRENARVVNAALPSVVRIIASRPAEQRMKFFGSKLLQLPFPGHPQIQEPPDDAAYSSGVILTRDGYMLTNEHAVYDFKNFEVELHDKRTFRARVVAADALVDVAILKIEASDLVPLPWGDSDKVQVGEQVFAIGNPFDLADSVSKGIVSAKGRNLPQSETDVPHLEDFIQTDAAINPGNSGGALINIHGELIGLNAAIASTTRLNMGIGFAIPSNLVRYAVEGLFKEGHLVRGYLGVILPDSVDDGVVSELNLKSNQGALLADIKPDSPASKANLHPFDFITAVGGHKIDSEAALRLIVAQLPIGKEVKVDFVRQGKAQSTTVKIEELSPDEEVAEQDEPASDGPVTVSKELPGAGNVLTGLQVAELNDKNRKKYNVDADIATGVVVDRVQDGSPANLKGISPGDVIESFSMGQGNSEILSTTNDFAKLAVKLKPQQSVVLLVFDSQKRNSFIYLAPAAK